MTPVCIQHSPVSSPPPAHALPGTRTQRFLASLNFVVAILGYSIAMALLSPIGVDLDVSSGENRLVTWPFRIFALLLGVATLISVRSRPMPKWDWRFGLFAFFWCIYLLRAFYDLEIRTDLQTPPYRLLQTRAFLIQCILSLVCLIKSVDLLDFRRIANWIFYIGGIALVASLFSIQKVADASWTGEISDRTNASAMLNTISFGHLGLSVAIVAFYKLSASGTRLAVRILGGAAILLGAYVVLRAGSRGPMLCAFVAALFYALSRSRYAVIGVFLSGVFAGVVYVFFPQILEIIRTISPVMADRISGSVYEGDSSGRDSLISEYWREICENPLTGGHLDMLGYSHNACFDGLLMFGFIFGWIILALVLIGYHAHYRILKEHRPHWWIALLGIQSLTAIQTSGTFGGNAFVQSLWVIGVVWTGATFVTTGRGFRQFPADK